MSSAARSIHVLSSVQVDRDSARSQVDEPSGVILREALRPTAGDADASDAGPSASAARESERLQALLAMDRRDAGESRALTSAPALATSSYVTPVRVLWRRYYRAQRRVLIRRAALSGLAVLAVALSCAFAFRNNATRSATESAPKHTAGVSAVVAVPRLPPRQAAPSLEAVHEEAAHEEAAHEEAAREPGAAKPAVIESMSTRRRLVRADALLRHPSESAARDARALLELTLPQVPKDAHGRASLAEACLRLGDERCARTAIGDALALRPQRSRYLALAREVDRAFRVRTSATAPSAR